MRYNSTLIVSILFLIVIFTACNESSETSIKRARLESVIYFKLTDTLMKLADSNFIPYAIKNGWAKRGDTLELIAPLRNVQLIASGGKEYRSDSNGYLIDIPVAEKKVNDLALSGYEKNIIKKGAMLLQYPVIITKSGEVNLFKYSAADGSVSLRFEQQFGESPDCCRSTEHVTSADPMIDNVCLD